MGSEPAPEMMAYSESLSFDRRLASDDIIASIAHVHGLERGALLDASEAKALVDALAKTGEEFASSTFSFVPSDEDIHTAIERRVTELAGVTGAKLHTGRSRNDQVVTALRLYTRRNIEETAKRLIEFQHTVLDRARSAGQAYLPGYTHLQRAQPVSLAHLLLAHGWAFARDLDRLFQTRARLDVCSLGAGALGGSSLPLDPEGVARELGFARRFANSLDAVSDRDFVAETLFDLSLLAVHCSRLGEEIALYSSAEFGFYRLDDAWSTGSSMLPQKKNPDIAELARGKTGRMIGHLAGFLATLKSLPLAYNRDLQEDKEPLFDAFDQMALALPALSGLLGTLRFDTDRMQLAGEDDGLRAVDLAEWLVRDGVPFREAHGIVGQLIRRMENGEGTLSALVTADEHFGAPAQALFAPGASLAHRVSPGGSGFAAVEDQLTAFSSQLAADERRLAEFVR